MSEVGEAPEDWEWIPQRNLRHCDSNHDTEPDPDKWMQEDLFLATACKYPEALLQNLVKVNGTKYRLHVNGYCAKCRIVAAAQIVQNHVDGNGYDSTWTPGDAYVIIGHHPREIQFDLPRTVDGPMMASILIDVAKKVGDDREVVILQKIFREKGVLS